MAAGDINDPLSNIPNLVLVNQPSASAAPGAGYGRLEIVDGVLGIRMEAGAWVALTTLAAGLLTALTEKVSPGDTDLLLLQDESDASTLKKVQIQNLPTGGGEGSIATDSATLTGSNVTLSNSAWTTILSLTLAAGTWTLWAVATVNANASCSAMLRIHDGTTTRASATTTVPNTYYASIPVMAGPIVLGEETVLTLQGRTQGGQTAFTCVYQGFEQNEPGATRLVAFKTA